LTEALQNWDHVVQVIDPARLSALLNDIYIDRSERRPDASREDTQDNTSDPRNARLPDTLRERNARRPMEQPTLRLKDPSVSLDDATLKGTAIFVLELPTPYPKTFDSPIPIRVQIESSKLDRRQLTGRATAFGRLVRADFTAKLHFERRDVVQAAVAVAQANGIEKETLERLLSNIRVDVSAFGWVTILPTWAWLSASSLLPVDRPLLGTSDRLLPEQFGALPDSSFLNLGTIAVPSGALFDTNAPALGAHWSNFGQDSGFSLTAGGLVVPNLDQLGKERERTVNVYGYVDLYYVKRVAQSVDLGFGLTYSIDVFGQRAAPTPAHLHYLESHYQPWLPESRENVAPAEDRSGHRMMFMLKGTHDLLGG